MSGLSTEVEGNHPTPPCAAPILSAISTERGVVDRGRLKDTAGVAINNVKSRVAGVNDPSYATGRKKKKNNRNRGRASTTLEEDEPCERSAEPGVVSTGTGGTRVLKPKEADGDDTADDFRERLQRRLEVISLEGFRRGCGVQAPPQREAAAGGAIVPPQPKARAYSANILPILINSSGGVASSGRQETSASTTASTGNIKWEWENVTVDWNAIRSEKN